MAVWSRLGMGLLLSTLPFARCGMTQALAGGHVKVTDTGVLSALALLLALVNFHFVRGTIAIVMALVWLTLLLVWRNCCKKIFGGIAGDLLGAFNELCETVLIIIACS